MAKIRLINREDGKIDLLVRKTRAGEGPTRLIRGLERSDVRGQVREALGAILPPSAPVVS